MIVDFLTPDVVLEDGGAFTLRLQPAPSPASDEAYLVIDVYDHANVVHPDGHVGYWFYRPSQLQGEVHGRLIASSQGIDCELAGAEPVMSWRNEQAVPFDRLLVMAVLRSKSDDAILDLSPIPGFATAAQLRAFRGAYSRNWAMPRYAPPPARWAQGSAVIRIYARDIQLRDAVGNFCLEIFRMLKQHGADVRMYAENFDMALCDVIRPVKRLGSDVAQGDRLLYFFSTYDPHLQQLQAMPFTWRAVYYHGVTNPDLLAHFDPELADACLSALEQLRALTGFDCFAANSQASAGILAERVGPGGPQRADIRIVPPKLAPVGAKAQPVQGARQTATLLYVGRIKSHKKIEDLLRLHAEVLKLDPDARLWLVGGLEPGPYLDFLRHLQTEVLRIPEQSVDWTGSLSEEQLAARFRSATAYVSMSEDEGFCLPVLEAMQCGLPVFAYALPAVRELLGADEPLFACKDFVELAGQIHAWMLDQDRLSAITRVQASRANALLQGMDGRGVWPLLAPSDDAG